MYRKKALTFFILLLYGLITHSQVDTTYKQVIEGINWLPSQNDPNVDSIWQIAEAYLVNAPDTAKGEIYYQFAEFYYDQFKLDTALVMLEESVSHFRNARDSSNLAASLIYYGHACYDVENIAGAIDSYHEALAIYEALDMKYNIANAYNSIANAYSYIVDYQSSFQNYEKGLEIYKSINDSTGVSMIYSNIAGIFTEQDRFEESLHAYEEALKWSDHNINDQLDNVLGIGVIYEERKEYKKAQQQFKKAESLAQEIKDYVQLAYIYQNLAFHYVSVNNLDSAWHYIQLTEEYADTYAVKSLSTNISELKHGYYYARGEYKVAYDLLKKARNESDSFYGIDLTRQLQEVQAQYSTLKKEKELAQKDLELEKASNELQHNKNVRNGLVGGILFVLILVFLFYRSHKIKSRVNKLLVQKNTEIAEKNKEIRSIEEAKSKWFINIAHELRTPLTLVKGPVRHALRMVPSNDQVYDHLRIADRNVSRLQKLVDEILDISKMESGNMPLNLTNVNLTEVVLNALASFDGMARDLQVKLEMDLQPEEVIQCRADEEKIVNVVTNLISNALKFTHAGGVITVGLHLDNDLVRLYVRDTGDGILNEDLDRVFDRFYQASNSAGKQGGTGVGLALCKEIAKLHRGDLVVSSELGKGSYFELTIPFQKPLQEAMPDLDQKEELETSIEEAGHKSPDFQTALRGKKVLIVDDNQDMREYISTFLRNNFKILEARDGIEALEIIKNTPPDIIVSDIMMPRMDGVRLAREVKANQDWKNIPFITVSAIGDQGEKVRTLRVGIDDYLVKPFYGEELLVRIQNLIHNYSERVDSNSKVEDEISHEEKILINLEKEVNENIEDPNFNVQRLAQSANMSERQLYRYLKQMTGLTPASFVREIRLQRAMELIQKRIYKRTSQVSYAVGFQQPAYFSTVFKKRFGRLPTEYIES